jgi:hypothetical protein
MQDKITTQRQITDPLEQFKYLGTTLTHKKCIREEIKSRLKSQNACYHSVQNLVSSSMLSKNIKIKIHRTITLSVFFFCCMGEKCGLSYQERNIG